MRTADDQADFFQPSPDQRAHSLRLQAEIAAAIQHAGGCLSFADYMQLALYAPGLGYYTAGASKFGEAGDFITAPEVSSLFAGCVAQCAAGVLAELSGGDFLELGAGSGAFARDALLQLDTLQQLPAHYFILELSPDLRERQQQCLAELPTALQARVHWLETLPAHFCGLVFANEVLDAQPVERFRCTATGVEQICVGLNADGQLHEHFRPAPDELAQALEKITALRAAPIGYVSELNMRLPDWCRAIANSMQRGAVLIADYGYAQSEYYLPERQQGTLVCHCRHRAHGDPYFYPGLQDISAFVDFTALVEAMTTAELEFEGYTSQSQFLLQTGLGDLYAQRAADLSELDRLRLAQQVKTLSLPGEMGERFKVAGFSRGLHAPLQGFAIHQNHCL